MDAMLFSAAVAVAMLCAGVMGFAIQRGATCTVAAVDELLTERRATRLVAMAEASLWVAGGLALASLAGALPAMPGAYAVSAWTVIGGALLGFGAWVERACVFGAIARLGSGEWSYAATPVGFYAGCLTVGALFPARGAAPVERLAAASPVLEAAALSALVFVAFAAWRLLPALKDRGRGLGARVWAPHAATGVIGVTFVVILLAVGAVWAYTDVLAQLARGGSMRLALGLLCLAALYAGALLGGRTAGRWRSARPTPSALARCFAGGALMAWGSLLIPGSNDGMILVGMPLLRPYAWLGFASMCAAIAAAMLVQRGLAGAPGATR